MNDAPRLTLSVVFTWEFSYETTYMIKAVEVTRGVKGVKSVKDDMRLK
jgi:hypothetical protein